MEHVVHHDRPFNDLEDDQEREPLYRSVPETIFPQLVMRCDRAEMFKRGQYGFVEPITKARLLQIVPQGSLLPLLPCFVPKLQWPRLHFLFASMRFTSDKE